MYACVGVTHFSPCIECDPPCANGTCNLTVGACECDDGYIGTDCGTGMCIIMCGLFV